MPQSVFFSYRRDDEPGYVARLSDVFVREFGDVVFRDVDQIKGGDNWKSVLTRQLENSEIVLALIGPRWLSTLKARLDTSIDYVRFELNTAKELDIPVIPVLVSNATMPDSQLLGDLYWLAELQPFTLSDEQNRWFNDSLLLSKRVKELTNLTTLKQPDGHQKWIAEYKWPIGFVLILLILTILVMLLPKSNTNILVHGVGGQDVETGDVTIEMNQ